MKKKKSTEVEGDGWRALAEQYLRDTDYWRERCHKAEGPSYKRAEGKNPPHKRRTRIVAWLIANGYSEAARAIEDGAHLWPPTAPAIIGPGKR